MFTCSSPPSDSTPAPDPDIDLGPSLSRCPGCKSQWPGYNENPRNLVVCIDGTGNEFCRENTNVVKLFAQIDLRSRNPEQLAYYSSGIGTDPNSFGFIKILDMAFGRNIGQIIKDAYRWLAEKYKEGDRIYLFGFSRGAYQVRILAGMIHEVGLIRTPTEKQIKAAYDYFKAIRSGEPKTRQIAREFKNTFSWEGLRVHFVGVWDTVSSVGLARGDLFLSTSSSAAHACHFRHALALDERRVKFMPEYFHEMNSQMDGKKSKYIISSNMEDTSNSTGSAQVSLDGIQTDSASGKNRAVDMKEVWFAGCHADVGGKNKPGRSHVSGNVSLLWMRQEATNNGLKLQPTDLVWMPADLDFGISNSMNMMWSACEHVPFKHQMSFSGPGEDGRSLHRSQPRRIIPGQKIHSSILYANLYTPRATLGEGFDVPIIQAESGELEDEIWEVGLFDETAAEKLLGHLDDEGVVPTYLDRLLFMLRFKEGKRRVRAVPNWQEKFTELIYDYGCEPLVKLAAILVYCEASVCDPDIPPDSHAPTHDELVTILKEIEASRTLQAPNHRDGPRIISLLRPLMRHQVLRKHILTSEVLEKLVRVIDAIVAQQSGSFGQAMDGLICLLQCKDTRDTIIGKLGAAIRPGVSRLCQMLETDDCQLLVAALRMILTLARIPAQEVSEARDACSAVRHRLECLATRDHDEDSIGLLAVEILLALHDPGREFNVLNKTFQVNLGRALVHLQSNKGGHGSAVLGLQTLRQHFGLDAGVLTHQHQKLIEDLMKAVQKGSARERTVSTMALLKLCESATICKYLSEVHLLDVFIDQLQYKGTALVAAHALAACLKYDDMEASAVSNEKLPKHIVDMLRLDYFDDAVGTVEGFQIFGDLMSHDGLREKIKEDVVTEVLNMKLGKGKVKEVRTSLICLDIFRSLDEEGRWTHNLVKKGLEHLEVTNWEEQKAGVTVLSALARTNHGVAAIDPRMVDIVKMLLPKGSSDLPIPSVSSMMGPACALRILAQNPKLRHSVRKTPQYGELKHLYLSGMLLADKPNTSAWKIKTPNRGDVIDMLDKVIKAIDGELSEEDLIPIDGNVLPHIQHLDRWLRMIGNGSVVAVVGVPVLIGVTTLAILSVAGTAAAFASVRVSDFLVSLRRRDAEGATDPPESSEQLRNRGGGARSEHEGEGASRDESESLSHGRNVRVL